MERNQSMGGVTTATPSLGHYLVYAHAVASLGVMCSRPHGV